MFEPNYEEVIDNLITPAYVFDVDYLCERIRFIKNVFGENIHLCYAMKANPFIIKSIEGIIDRYEVCSQGEFEICERADIEIGKILLSGVYKEEADLRYIISKYRDKVTYTSESVVQFRLIHTIAQQIECTVNVLLRVTTGNQFGMSEKELCNIIDKRNHYPNVKIIGIHHFSGTQRKKMSVYKEELKYIDDLICKLEDKYDYIPEELEFGPGFYVEYFQNAKAYSENELLKDFSSLLNSLNYKGKITLELGRFIVAHCGNYYTDIVDYKVNEIPYCIVNGGMHQITYFGQMMAMKIPYFRHLKKEYCNQEEYTKCNVSGALCTINDNLVKGMMLQNPQVGDIIEFQRTGAYAMCEGVSLFLSRDLPCIYLYSKKDGLHLQRPRFETNILNYKQ